ncbi:diguanylate cyclase [Variovorax paradoxus]|uniref:GGDEF domain-containing protein n=1 Tax=Variovorax paradoxus TaxID=34073 RepID=UPI00193233F2|nr:GGDEF domain-containing protein [Variovorax paradoxus]
MAALPSVLDPRSVIMLAGLMGVVMSVVVFFMRRSYPATIQGLREWAWAPLVAFVSTLLFAARDVLPDFITIVVANVVLFEACLLYYAGSQRFLYGRSDTAGWHGLTVVMACALFWFSEFRPDYEVRLVIVTAVVAALFLSHALLYIRHRGSVVFGMRLMIGLLLLQSLVAFARLVSALLGMAGVGLLDATVLQSIYISMYSFTVLLLSIAAILMATDRMHSEFQFLATHDPLTGVLNRRALLDACQAQLAAAGRDGGSRTRRMALLMIDVDHFKSINDRFGHQTGDAVLREAVGRMQRAIGDNGLLGRYGGEEFVVMLPEASPAEATELAARVKASAGEAFPADSPLAAVGAFTVSIGVAPQQPGADIDDMLGQADEALYRAKSLGRDRVVLAG